MTPSYGHTHRLLEAGQELSSELSQQVITRRLVELAREITGARECVLAELDRKRRIRALVTSGSASHRRGNGRELLERLGGRSLIGSGPAPPVPRISAGKRTGGSARHRAQGNAVLGAGVMAAGRLFGNVYLAGKRRGEEFSAADERALDILAGQAGVAITNARLFEESQDRRRWLEALHRITGAILDGSTPDRLLEMVADSVRELVGADMATICAPAGKEETLVIIVASGSDALQVRGTRVPSERSLPAEVIRRLAPMVLDNVSQDPRVHPAIARLNMGPKIFVPLRSKGVAFGTLAVANHVGGRRFGPATVRMVEAFADQASIVIEHARAQQRLAQLAVTEERERIAKEIHDGIIQSLFGVGIHLDTLATLSRPLIAPRLDDAIADIDHSIRELRAYILALRPSMLGAPFRQAVQDLCQSFSHDTHVSMHLKLDPAVASQLSLSSADLIAVVREALSNIRRHAAAAHGWIELTGSEDLALLTIRDDGKGFDRAISTAGNGLADMEERVRKLGGGLHVLAAPGTGTCLDITLPLVRELAVAR